MIDLSHFTGSENIYAHFLKTMTFTDGARHFAEQARAFWWLDIVATELIPLQSEEEFIHVRLTVANGKAEASADDGNGNPLWAKAIPFTDCPDGAYRFYLYDRVLMLPSEY